MKIKVFIFTVALCTSSLLFGQKDSIKNKIYGVGCFVTYWKNEMCVQNFFPSFFTNGGGTNALIYRRYFNGGKSGIRFKISGNYTEQKRNAFNNNDLAVPIPEEYNRFDNGNSNFNYTLGFQHLFLVYQRDFQMYALADFTLGFGNYNSTSMWVQNSTGVGKGRTILSFNLTDVHSSNQTMMLNTGIGAQMKCYKNFFIAFESVIVQVNQAKVTSNATTVKNIEYTISSNSYFPTSVNVTSDPSTTATNLYFTPSSAIYFTYKF